MDFLSKIQGYKEMFDDFINKMTHKKYYYMDNESFINILGEGLFNGQLNESTQIYWKEQLFRAHFVSVTSILRNAEWINGMEFGVKDNNYLVFSASLRGLIESVTDSYYSLEIVPTSLALNFNGIKKALEGNLNNRLVADEFERLMIHFEFASKDEKAEDKKALSAGRYIAEFDEGNNVDSKSLFKVICQLAHPAAMSIRCFRQTVKESDIYEYSKTTFTKDKGNIEKLYEEYKEAIEMILKFSLFLPILCLKVINLFEFKEIYCEYLDSCIASNIISNNAMEKINEMIKDSLNGSVDINKY